MSTIILQAVASGIVTGCVYALIALSLVLVYKSTDAINFAGGEMVMAGGYIGMAALLFFYLPYPIAFVATAAAMFLISGMFDRVVLNKILGRSMPGQTTLVAMVIACVGLSDVLKGVVRVFPYTEEVRRLPAFVAGESLELGPVILQRQDIAIVVVAILIMVALWAFFQFTMTGKALRATSQNPRAAALVGVPVKLMRMSVWGIAGLITAVAGILYGSKLPMTPDIGIVVILAFAAAIIGGFTSLPGCIAGGIVLGVIQNLAGFYISSKAIAVAPFLVIMITLVLRPQGLFGGKMTAKKV